MNSKMLFLINIRHKMKRIQAKKHKIGTYEIDKISLSCFDDKRFVLDDGVNKNKKCDKNENNNHDDNDKKNDNKNDNDNDNDNDNEK